MFTVKRLFAALVLAVLSCALCLPPGNAADAPPSSVLSGNGQFRSGGENFPDEPEEDHVPGEVLVVFRAPSSGQRGEASEGITAESVENGTYADYMNSLADIVGAEVVETYGILSEYAVQVRGGGGGGIFARLATDEGSEEDVVKRLNKMPEVLGAQLNYKYYALGGVTPSDSKYSSLWGMPAINAPEAWEIETGSENVYVAVIDSGIDYTHADIAPNFETKGYSGNYSLGTAAGDYSDGNGHGTHVAGTIGAVGNNGLGVAGVNWKMKLISLRIFPASGGCTTNEIMNALEALLKLLNDNPTLKVASVNMSYGRESTSAPSGLLTTPEYLAYKALSDTNRIVMCVAAGNSWLAIGNGFYHYPASFTGLSNMIVVANAENSPSYPRNWTSCYSTTYVDIAAPGTSILSTVPQSCTHVNDSPSSVQDENGYKYMRMTGTSMAAPHVAGAVALLAAACPEASAHELKQAILDGANQNYATDYTVNGFLDVEGSLEILRGKYRDDILPEIRTAELAGGMTTVAYSRKISAKGSRPLTWTLESGNLPAGLELSDEGCISESLKR